MLWIRWLKIWIARQHLGECPLTDLKKIFGMIYWFCRNVHLKVICKWSAVMEEYAWKLEFCDNFWCMCSVLSFNKISVKFKSNWTIFLCLMCCVDTTQPPVTTVFTIASASLPCFNPTPSTLSYFLPLVFAAILHMASILSGCLLNLCFWLVVFKTCFILRDWCPRSSLVLLPVSWYICVVLSFGSSMQLFYCGLLWVWILHMLCFVYC